LGSICKKIHFEISYDARKKIRRKKIEAHFDAGDFDPSGRGNDICLVDPPQRDAVDLRGPADEKETRGELLEEDDSLPPVLARDEDEDGARDDRRAQTGRAVCLSGDLLLPDVLGRVEAGGLVERDGALLSVVGASDAHDLGLLASISAGSGGSGLVLALVERLFAIERRTTESPDVWRDLGIARAGVSNHLRDQNEKKNACVNNQRT
jgi:hypothetical protein